VRVKHGHDSVHRQRDAYPLDCIEELERTVNAKLLLCVINDEPTGPHMIWTNQRVLQAIPEVQALMEYQEIFCSCGRV
jgi:hypothetical protein